MSDHHQSHKQAKHEKKLAMLLKNRRTQRINLSEDILARERDLEAEREEERKKSQVAAGRNAALKNKKQAEPVWSARMQEIRDRTTGKTRMATERWNRFAGTESGGGRGL